MSYGEVLRGVNAVAGALLAPPQGQLVGALAVIGQQDSLDMSADGHIARMLRRAIAAYQRAAPLTAPARIELPPPQNADDRPVPRAKAAGHHTRARRT